MAARTPSGENSPARSLEKRARVLSRRARRGQVLFFASPSDLDRLGIEKSCVNAARLKRHGGVRVSISPDVSVARPEGLEPPTLRFEA